MHLQTDEGMQLVAHHAHIFQRSSSIRSMVAQPAYSAQNENPLMLPHDNHTAEFAGHGKRKDILQKVPSPLAEKPGRFDSEHD
jgi:hypothetical protein